MNDEQTQNFIKEYRDALGRQRDTTMQSLENARRNAFQGIMGGANTAGMMYSNFPERSKIQYDANTYMPGITQAETTYQTGLNKLQSSIINNMNQISELNDEVASLNKQVSNANKANNPYALNDASDYYFMDNSGGTQFRNSKNDRIKFGTAAKRAGYTTNQQILDMAQKVLNEGEYNRLQTIFDMNQGTKMPNLYYNIGKDYVEKSYLNPDGSQRLSNEDAALLNRLGLMLGE